MGLQTCARRIAAVRSSGVRNSLCDPFRVPPSNAQPTESPMTVIDAQNSGSLEVIRQNLVQEGFQWI